jgi:hypothetical protein
VSLRGDSTFRIQDRGAALGITRSVDRHEKQAQIPCKPRVRGPSDDGHLAHVHAAPELNSRQSCTTPSHTPTQAANSGPNSREPSEVRVQKGDTANEKGNRKDQQARPGRLG